MSEMADDGKVIIDTSLDDSGVISGMKKLSGTLAKAGGAAIKGTAVAIGATAVAIGALTTASVKATAANQQLIGGVDTLFKENSNKLQSYANEAYKTAGMSANAYMESVTSFSASLLQGLGGDTAAAADYANQALIDMSDNANKFGTDMEAIQFAYQGFSKQNFTMLDNLKLGYGGTKEEMQRLLTDAQKLSGVKYDISNFADITKAINVIQTELGITGTTAKEASTTITGSFGMVSASFENLLVALGTGDNIDGAINNLVDSVGIAFENLIPVIGQSLLGIDQLVRKIMPMIFEQLPVFFNLILPQFIELGGSILESLVNGITENMPAIVSAIMRIANIIMEALPQFAAAGIEIITGLIKGMSESLPGMMPQIIEVISMIMGMLTENLPIIAKAGLDLLMGLMDGLAKNLPTVLPQIIGMIETIGRMIASQLPLFAELSVIIITQIANALIENQDIAIESMQIIFLALIDTIFRLMPLIIAAMAILVTSLIAEIKQAVPAYLTAGIEIITGFWDGLLQYWSTMAAVPKKLLDDLVEDIKSAGSKFFDAGVEIARNIIDGFVKKIGELKDKITAVKDEITQNLAGFDPIGGVKEAVKNGIGNITSSINVQSANASVQSARNGVQSVTPVNVIISADAKKLFNTVVTQNNDYARGGYSPLVTV